MWVDENSYAKNLIHEQNYHIVDYKPLDRIEKRMMKLLNYFKTTTK